MPRREAAGLSPSSSRQADTGESITLRDAVELGRTPGSPPQPWSATDDAIVEEALGHSA
jgi:iron complex transport system ATP-binding protein